MYVHIVAGIGSYTTSTTNMYKKDFTYRVHRRIAHRCTPPVGHRRALGRREGTLGGGSTGFETCRGRHTCGATLVSSNIEKKKKTRMDSVMSVKHTMKQP